MASHFGWSSKCTLHNWSSAHWVAFRDVEILEPQPLPPPPSIRQSHTSGVFLLHEIKQTVYQQIVAVAAIDVICFSILKLIIIAIIDCTTSHFFFFSLHSFVNAAHQSLEGDLFQHMCHRCKHAQTSPFQFPDELVSMSKLLRESTSE